MSEDPHSMPEPFSVVVSRRRLLQAAGALAAVAAVPGMPALAETSKAAPLGFSDLPLKVIYDHAVADGYQADVLIRWGDPIFRDAPPFVAEGRRAEAQERQFGTCNDFVGYFPLPAGSQSSEHGILAVNHEFPTPKSFFPSGTDYGSITAAQALADQASLGMSMVEVKKTGGQWRIVRDGRYNRRITPSTLCLLSGPVAGHERVKTLQDKTGRNVRGTIANCAGGKTPWGTVLTAEENFQNYFRGVPPEEHPEFKPLADAGITGKGRSPWGLHEFRFDAGLDSQEANRFGYIVEIDPYDPTSAPVKRTHLGRFRHEAASTVIDGTGRVVVYMGEDRAGGFIYRFVSKGTYRAGMTKIEAGRLLDEGVLYAAKFTPEGLTWMPLTPDQPLLSGLPTLADIMIEVPRAALAVGATPMDRPEDMEFNPVNGRIYVNLTMNLDRTADATDAANPRGPNQDGHILEIAPPDGQHLADRFAWNILMLCGPEGTGAKYGPGTQVALSGPDNLAIDPKGRLWIATDNWRADKEGTIPNGLFACAVDGPQRAMVKFFYNVPLGAELCGPEFTPDGETLFVAVQDPGPDPSGAGLNWPDKKKGIPPRSSVVVITRKGGGSIGG
jgi:uncharacterized protein